MWMPQKVSNNTRLIRQYLRIIRRDYYISFKENRPKSLFIFCLDGRFFHNGLADRLRGMVSMYLYSKIHNREYRIEHLEPFALYNYFIPNKVDWVLKKNEKSNNLLYSNPVMILKENRLKQKLKLLLGFRQIHVFTSVSFLGISKIISHEYTFSELFQELFKPSPRLLSAVGPFQGFIDKGYISASFRFMQLMGDFHDEVNGEVLSEQERETYMQICINCLTNIFEKSNVEKVLVTSDSARFIERAKLLPFVFTLPGQIGHIGCSSSEDVILKTFVDFYMISQAKKVFQIKTGKMYRGGFSRVASASTNVPYEYVEV